MGRHRISRRAKLTTGALGLVIAVGVVTVSATAGDPAPASADGADRSLFADILTVPPNVRIPAPQRKASKGTFTVDCGRNENGHFNPDNFIAQPGVRNGAQHLHDYVGNLSTNADSSNRSLARAGTTCKNGDKSTYFWPVLRISEEEEPAENPPAAEQKAQRKQAQAADQQAKAQPRVDCPDVASQLPEEVPEPAQDEVDAELGALDSQLDAAEQKVQAGEDPAAVLEPLKGERAAAIDRMSDAIGAGLPDLAQCGIKDQGNPGVANGDENSDAAQAEGTAQEAARPQPEENDNNELEGNEGEIQRPAKVDLTFRGSPVTRVTAMPRFLRILYGDAKVSTNGPKNARDSWTCSGFEDRVLMNKYPICPEGSKVVRLHDFPSCWDGRNIDSANHRDHIVFPDQNGRCGRGFRAVPQLRITLTYDIPREVQLAGRYAVDSFPEEAHNPLSDHDDFANVMSQRIMWRLVNCVNRGRTCQE
ncbi:DUF1996 domain-containing protein [Amycolatopsis albispora]|uniref:DUF1996 domain-containing protein n=1 Tax=Amycolatopsis albispora TaxID=1804986 RepID=A0A344L565_9PSEU|nr:DUF1996 domain-containing protein [Amycolatopsis albispora]AXB43189.1 hypothetical protein A4R43_12025 [Amycolatopsis albispora]